MNSVVVTPADALWLLLPAIWRLTSVCWAFNCNLIIKLDFDSDPSLHHLNPASFLSQLLTGSHTALCAALLSDVAYTTLFSLRMAAVSDCQTHRRQNNSQNPWNVAIFPTLTGVVEGSRHKQSAVRNVASFLNPTVNSKKGEKNLHNLLIILTWSQN